MAENLVPALGPSSSAEVCHHFRTVCAISTGPSPFFGAITVDVVKTEERLEIFVATGAPTTVGGNHFESDFTVPASNCLGTCLAETPVGQESTGL